MKGRDLTKGNISKLILSMAVPAAIGMFFQTMYNVTDTFYAGLLSTESLAAMTLAFPIFMLIIGLGNGISIGSAALISNAIGENKKEVAKKYAWQAIGFSILISFVLMLFGFIFINPLLKFMGASIITLNLAKDYALIILYGTPLFLLVHTLNAGLMSLGDTKSLRNALLGGFILNLILDPFFMFGWIGFPAMGLKGIALCTVVIQFFAMIYLFYRVVKIKIISFDKIKNIIPKFKYYKNIAKQGFPASLNMIIMSVGMMILMFFLKPFGDPAIAAWGVASRVEQIIILPAIGLGMAMLSISGQNNGAKKYDRIKEALNISIKYGLTIIVTGAILILIFAKQLITFFTADPEVITIGITALRISALTIFGHMLFQINSTTLQGLKKPFIPMILALFRQFIIPISLFILFLQVFNLGILGIWLGLMIGSLSAAFTLYYIVRRKLNKLISSN